MNECCVQFMTYTVNTVAVVRFKMIRNVLASLVQSSVNLTQRQEWINEWSVYHMSYGW